MQSTTNAASASGEAVRAYSGTVAIALALILALFARVLFEFAEAGRAADLVAPAYPFIIGAAVFLSTRYALRALRYYRKAAASENKTRVGSLTLVVIALLINGLVGLFALFIGIMIVNGPIVQ